MFTEEDGFYIEFGNPLSENEIKSLSFEEKFRIQSEISDAKWNAKNSEGMTKKIANYKVEGLKWKYAKLLR